MILPRQPSIAIFLILATLCLTPLISPPLALLMGIIMAQIIEHPFPDHTKKATSFLLKASVVGLGFGMNASTALRAGREGFIFTIATISLTLFLGILLGKLFKVEKIISFLISGGTAICGGSAIAALSPVIKAKQNQISVALGVVFILNSVALLIFPFIGHILQMTQADFGLWCAVAIHDTSSVVGAAAKYGDESLRVATTVKLARALWIIPLALFSSFIFKSKDTKLQIPYFIGLFIVAIIINTYVPAIHTISPYIVSIAKAGLTLTLFLIGTGLSGKLLKSVGALPIIQGTVLWLIISMVTLVAILYY